MHHRAVLRQILRALPSGYRPCGTSELPRFRAAVVQQARNVPEADREEVGREFLFHLQAQKHFRELNARYFPLSELPERERVKRVANHVGLDVPKEFSDKA